MGKEKGGGGGRWSRNEVGSKRKSREGRQQRRKMMAEGGKERNY